MQTNKRKALIPLILVFILVNAFFISGKNMLQRWGADRDVLLIGNLILFAITLFSYWMAQRSLKSSNPHAFVRGIYSGMMMKLFTCAIAAFIYIATTAQLNKPALFTLMGLYLVYTFIEVSVLTKMLRQQKTNG